MMINHDDKVDNSAVHEKSWTLLGKNKRHLRTLAHSLGLKISFCLSSGQSSKELSKGSMQLWIMKKEFEMEMIENAEANITLAKHYLPSSSVSCLLYKGL
jgi:hypothetical protein